MSFLRFIRKRITGFPGLGRVEHYDHRSDAFPMEQVLPARLAAKLDAGVPLPALDDVSGFKLKNKRHHQRRWWLQDKKPFCTSYGTYQTMSADPVRQKKRGALLGDPDEFFYQIQAEDRRNGRHYSEGATGLAAMQAAVARGFFSEHLWTHNVDTAVLVVANVAPIMVGTNWRYSMWDADAEGIIRVKPGSPNAGGHWWTINGYDKKRGLLRTPTTWKKGEYLWIPVDPDFRIIAGEDAEMVLARELVVAAPPAAPAGALFVPADIFDPVDEDDGN